MDADATYEILDEIGHGEAAVVYRAYDSQLKRHVAIKELRQTLRADPRQLDHFREEAQFLANLEHDNVVKVYGIVKERGWIIMELMRGSLDTKLAEGPLPHDLVRSVLRQTLEGLKFLHQRGKIHGAIKPANLLINDEGRIRLSDSAGITAGGEVRQPTGSYKYLAPELGNPEFGPVTPAVDLYCLGFTALELLQGPKFDGLFTGVTGAVDEDVAWMRWHGSASERLPMDQLTAGLPADLAQVIRRSLEKEVTKRYASADEVLNDLASLPLLPVPLPGRPNHPIIERHGGTMPPPPRKPVKPNPPRKPGPAPWSKEWINAKLQDKRVLGAVCAVILLPALVFLCWPTSERLKVTITSEPTGAKITVNDTEYKKLTDRDIELAPGKYRLRLAKDGFKPIDEPIEVRASGKENKFSYTLKSEQIMVSVASRPSGAALAVDGEDTGKSTDARVPMKPGKRTIRLTLAGFVPLEKPYVVDEDKEDQSVSFTLTPQPGPVTTVPQTPGQPQPARRFALLIAGQGGSVPDAEVDELAQILPRAGYLQSDIAVCKGNTPASGSISDQLRNITSGKSAADTLLVVAAAADSLSLPETLSTLAGCPAGQKLLVADLPESGPVPAGVTVLFSRTGGQQRYMHLNWHRSVFMKAVNQGLAGQADLDHDGQVTADELSRFVTAYVAEYLRKDYPQQPGQTPTRQGSGPPVVVATVRPDGVLQYYSRGVQKLESGDPRAAAEDFSQAINRDAGFVPARLARALARYQQGPEMRADALADCTAAVTTDPTNADALALRGELFADAKRELDALSDLDNVMRKLAPDWSAPYQTRGRIYRGKKAYTEALEDLNKAASLAPQNYTIFEDRGATYYEKGDYDKAEADFRQANALNRNWYLPYQDLSYLFKKKGDAAQAEQWQKACDRVKAGMPPP
jgi:serine/threonine-protein kinase